MPGVTDRSERMSTKTDLDIDAELEAFRTLRQAWSLKRHAVGGLAAMAGFEFQLASALHVVVRQEAQGDGGGTFVEVLSDFVERDDGYLITQAKRTLTSAAFRSALEELWGVHRLAVECVPQLVPSLRYRVQAARRTLIDWPGSLDRWQPQDADPEILSVFKARVDVAVLPSPRLEAAKVLVEELREPDPFTLLDRTMARLLAAPGADLDQVVDEFRTTLRGLRVAASDVQRRFGIWSCEDMPPDAVVHEEDDRRAVRIGERLSIFDLREGRLANRSIYDRIERACEERLAGERPLYKLPVFWISGRSGCGKSAALLHIASRLHAQNPDRLVLWLGQRPELVAPAMRWAGRMATEGQAVVLVLDDPFTAERQSAFTRAVIDAQAEWEGLSAGASGSARTPLLLCCGPTEQRSAAEDACAGQLDFDGFDMPQETEGDFAELAEWYGVRTGRPVVPMDGNVLLVQQLFEWTKGSIAEFAIRFRDRIRSFDAGGTDGPVYDAVSSILALNRLYVDYPSSELRRRQREHPELESALIQLQELEAHFEFTAQATGGVRLTHPHLADAIYREWFARPTDRPWRKRHLAASLALDLATDERAPEVRHAPFWAISRLARERDGMGREMDPALRARIDLIRTELREVLASIYRAGVVDGDHPVEDLPVWLALDRLLDLRLDPSPAGRLVEAVDAIDEPVRGLRLSCHWLLAEQGRFRERAVGSVRNCLRRLAAWGDPAPWHDWAPLALDFVSREGADDLIDAISSLSDASPHLRGMSRLMNRLASDDGSPRARQIVLGWLQRTSDDEFGWGAVLTTVMEKHGHCEVTDALSRGLLESGRDRVHWARVWSMRVDVGRGDATTLRALGTRWLGLSEGSVGGPPSDTPGWDMIWRRLVESTGSGTQEERRLLMVGREWTEAADVADERWTRVWPTAFVRSGNGLRAELIGMAAERLSSAPSELAGWSFVWCPAIDEARRSGDAPLTKRLESIGGEWLSAADVEHLGWGFVFDKLIASVDPEVRRSAGRSGVGWLHESSGEHRSWAHVWLALVDGGDHASADLMRERGLAWLRRAPPEHPGWSRVAGFLMEHGSPAMVDAARDLTTAWLLRQEGHAGWRPVIASWMATEPSDEERRAFHRHCAEQLGRRDLNSELWLRMWLGARKSRFPTADLVHFAVEFLVAGRGSESIRASLCAYALEWCSNREHRQALVAAGMAIIRSDAIERSWTNLWEGLAKRAGKDDRPELLDAASSWLLTNGLGHERWDRILVRARGLDRQFTRRDGIACGMTGWLRGQSDPERWIKVWSLHPDREGALRDREVLTHGAAVASRVLDHGAWFDLCALVLSRTEGDTRERVLRAGRSWLDGPTGRYGFGQLWRAVWACERGERRRAMIAPGLLALPDVELRNWYPMFAALMRFVHPDQAGTDVIRSVDRWLGSDAAGGRGWSSVLRWRQGVRPSPWRDEAVVARAQIWLSRTPFEDPYWGVVWRSVSRSGLAEDVEALVRLGGRWLQEARADSGNWPSIWRSLWDLSADDRALRHELRGMGVRWLSDAPNHRDRALVRSQLA